MSKIDRATTMSGINGRRTIELDNQEVVLIDISDSRGKEATACFAATGRCQFLRCNCDQFGLYGQCDHEGEAKQYLPELQLVFVELDDRERAESRQLELVPRSRKSTPQGRKDGLELLRQALSFRSKVE
jgi:hypothetical protein